MAFNLGSGSRRRWHRRAAARHGGRPGAGGCRHFHFHVHHHLPCQVCAFSSLLRLPFSLLSYLLILPVLSFTVFAFFVCFGWFTMVYFVSSMLRQCNSRDVLENRAGNSNEPICRNEEQERNKVERDGNSNDLISRNEEQERNELISRNEEQQRNELERDGDSVVAEGTGRSAVAEDCLDGQQQIKEVFVDGCFDASLEMSRVVSPDDCIKDEEQSTGCMKLVEEVTVFEANCKESNNGITSLDISSAKQQLQENPADDWFAEEIGSREFVANRTEVPAMSETPEFIDKHETRAVAVICSENSAEYNVKCGVDLPDETFSNKFPEDVIDGQQDAKNMVADWFESRFFVTSDETLHINNDSDEMSWLPLGSLGDCTCATVATSNASFHRTNSDEEDGHEKEHGRIIAGLMHQALSLVSDFAEKNSKAVREEIGVPSTEDSTRVVVSGSSVIGRTEDAFENTFTSEGGSARLPVVRRSQRPWWNLCGVLDVIAGCKD